MREIVPVGEAPRHARSGPAQVLRRIGGDRRPGREPVTTEGGDDNAGIARARDRDFTRGRAPDQRHAFCPRPDLPQQGLQVMRLRAENHQEFRVAVKERVTRSHRAPPRAPILRRTRPRTSDQAARNPQTGIVVLPTLQHGHGDLKGCLAGESGALVAPGFVGRNA